MAGCSPSPQSASTKTGPRRVFWSMEADDAEGAVYRPFYGQSTPLSPIYWPFLKGFFQRYRHLTWLEKTKDSACVYEMSILESICRCHAQQVLQRGPILSVDLKPCVQNYDSCRDTFRGFGLLEDDSFRLKVQRYTLQVFVNGVPNTVTVPGDVYALRFLVDELEAIFGPGYLELESSQESLVTEYLETDYILLGLSYCTSLHFTTSVLDIS